jgi:adenosine 3'-phospho 5'-phosphosulfate transporter B3
MLVSFLILGSVSLSNLALLWCSYPAKVAFKSAKLIPTMIIGSLLLRKRYSSTHLIAAGCLCVGLIGVTLADKFANLPITTHVSSHSDVPLSVDQVDPSSFDWGTTVGITLLLVSIILDSVIPNLQEQLFNSSATAAFEGRTPSSDSVMMCTNLVGVSFLLIPLFGFHQFADAVAFISVPENNHVRTA